jgi:hypothetical protein
MGVVSNPCPGISTVWPAGWPGRFLRRQKLRIRRKTKTVSALNSTHKERIGFAKSLYQDRFPVHSRNEVRPSGATFPRGRKIVGLHRE